MKSIFHDLIESRGRGNETRGALGSATVVTENPLFVDHFPEMAIVPGSFSLGLVIGFLEGWCRDSTAHTTLSQLVLKKISFLAPVKPGDRIHIKLLSSHRNGNTSVARIRASTDRGTSVLEGVIELEHE